MSAPLLAAVIRAHGLEAEFVDAADLITTDDVHGGAEPIMDLTEANCRQILLPLLEKGVVPVVTGFVGKSTNICRPCFKQAATASRYRVDQSNHLHPTCTLCLRVCTRQTVGIVGHCARCRNGA